MVRAQILSKRQPFKIEIMVDSFTFNKDYASKNSSTISSSEYSLYYKRGSKNSSSTLFQKGTSKTIDFNSFFSFKATMFKKKLGYSKKLIYFILQKRKLGSTSISSEAKVTLDLGEYAKKLEQSDEPSVCITERLKLGSIGDLQVGITLENLDSAYASTTSMMMTTMDETTAVDSDMDFEMDDDFNEEMKEKVQESKKLRNELRTLQKEVVNLTSDNPFISNSSEDVEEDSRYKETENYLITELKNEIETIKEKYEQTQFKLKAQLDDERATLQELKKDYEKKMKFKEIEVAELKYKLETYKSQMNSNEDIDEDDNNSKTLELEQLRQKYNDSLSEFESVKETREKFYQNEKKKDELRIRELEKELSSYQLIAKRNTRLKKENQMDMDESKIESIQGELKQLQKEKKSQEEKENAYKNEIETLNNKIKEFELSLLSEELKRNEEINEIKERAIKSERKARKLYDELDEKIANENILRTELKDLESQVANILTEKNQSETKLINELNQSQSRIIELENIIVERNAKGIVLEGYMTKRGRIIKSWKKRYFVLFQTKFLTYSSEPQSDLLGGVIINSVSDTIVSAKKTFKINSGKRTLYCYPEPQEFEKWKSSFQDLGVYNV